MIPKDDFPDFPAREEGNAEEPKEVMSLFELLLEPATEESLDADQDDTAVYEIDEIRRQIKESGLDK